MEFIHTGRVATIIEDVCSEANRKLSTGFTVYAEDSVRWAVEKAIENVPTYTTEELAEDVADSGEVLEDRGEDNRYYNTQDLIDAIDSAWAYNEVNVDNLIYTQDGVDIALAYPESWEFLTDYGYSLEDFDSLESVLFRAAVCFTDHVANELAYDGISAVKDEIEIYSA